MGPIRQAIFDPKCLETKRLWPVLGSTETLDQRQQPQIICKFDPAWVGLPRFVLNGMERKMSSFLVGIDGSECGDRALDAAAAQAEAAGAVLIVCYVIAWSPYSFSTPQENAERHKRREEELDAARSKLLEPRARALAERGIGAEGVARHGHPVRTLIKLAEDRGVEMIVIGRSGDSPIRSRMFGGTAASLVQSSPVPVLVVP